MTRRGSKVEIERLRSEIERLQAQIERSWARVLVKRADEAGRRFAQEVEALELAAEQASLRVDALEVELAEARSRANELGVRLADAKRALADGRERGLGKVAEHARLREALQELERGRPAAQAELAIHREEDERILGEWEAELEAARAAEQETRNGGLGRRAIGAVRARARARVGRGPSPPRPHGPR